MPLYVIERNFAENLDLSGEDVRLIDEINADEGVRWLFSFLSADRRRTYCLYEAPSPDAIVAAARRADVPVGEGGEAGGAGGGGGGGGGGPRLARAVWSSQRGGRLAAAPVALPSHCRNRCRG